MKRAGGAAVSDGGGAVVVTSTQCVAPWVRAAVWCVIARGAARGRQRVDKGELRRTRPSSASVWARQPREDVRSRRNDEPRRPRGPRAARPRRAARGRTADAETARRSNVDRRAPAPGGGARRGPARTKPHSHARATRITPALGCFKTPKILPMLHTFAALYFRSHAIHNPPRVIYLVLLCLPPVSRARVGPSGRAQRGSRQRPPGGRREAS